MSNLISTETKISKKFLMAGGRYYIGDPCYVFSQDNWSNILEKCDYFRNEYTNEKGTAIAFETRYGDGTYEDEVGNLYDVDAGLIGIVPVEMLEVSVEEIGERELGHIFTFHGSFYCRADKGDMQFGHIHIDTAV